VGYPPPLMQSRLRVFIALLLLVAAGVHPLVHVATQDCPCVHGATVALDGPAVAPAAATAVTHPDYVSATLTRTQDGELPPRAPPAA